MKPGRVSGSVRAAPPGWASASKTSTLSPACARTIAAARPLGPDPMTEAWDDELAGVSLMGLIMRRQRVGPLDNSCFAVGSLGEHGRVEPEKLASPPVAGVVLLLHRGEPVLPEHGTDVFRRGAGEGIVLEEREDVRAIGEQAL